MVSFRRCILALTVLALFAGLASAQVSAWSGYGLSLAQKLCSTLTTGCTQYVGNVAGVTLGTAVDSCATFAVGGACTTTSSVFGANVFQGIVSGNSVTWFGIPVLA